MTPRTQLVIIAGVAAVIAAAVLPACTSTTNSASSQGTTASTSVVTDTAKAGDIAFAQMMIPHHEQAVEMAEIAESKTSASADVKNLAAGVKKAQEPEIQLMKGWLTAWGAPVTPTGSGMDHGSAHGMMSDADMDALKQAEGTTFDRKWLTMMIDHHDGAVTMAEDVLRTTSNNDVKVLATSIISSQQAEITTMEKLLENR